MPVAFAIRKPAVWLCTLILLTSIPQQSAATLEETLPSFHWSYRLLDQLRLRGYFTDLFISNRPFTRGEIARSVGRIRSEIDAGRRQPSPAEAGLLDQLTAEFRPELNELSGTTEPNRLKLGLTGTLDLVHRSHDLERSDLIYYGVLHAGTKAREAIRSKISIGLGDHLTLYHSLRIDRNLTDDPAYVGRVFKRLAALTEQAYIQGRFSRIHFKFGRDFLVLGSGKSGKLLLSDNSRPFDLYSIDLTASFIKFTAFGIALDDVPLDSVVARGQGPVNTAKRFINGHRLDLRLGRWGSVGVSEVIIYGGPRRSFELAFVNPVNFYHGEQINDESLGRPGNELASIDIDLFPTTGAELFGELLIDDVKIERVNTSDLEPSKIGYLVGAQYANPLGLDGLEVRAEYTRMANRTYSVLFNDWERFLHRHRPIGYFLGNNFDRLELMGSGWPARTVFVSGSYEYSRQGQDNITSPYNLDYLNVASVDQGYHEAFPFGPVQRTHAMNLCVQYVPSTALRFQVDARVAHVKDFGFTPGVVKNQLQLFRAGVFVNYDRIMGWK